MEDFWSIYSKQMATGWSLGMPSYLLVEASGDSESVDFDPSMSVKDHSSVPDDGNDDAESCSLDVSDCRSFSCSCARDDLDGSEGKDNKEAGFHGVDDIKDQENGGGIDQGYRSWVDEGHVNGLQVNQKSCVSVESTKEPMSEMEKNRLFWETCLAS